jgi:hypothetical protein
MSDRWAEEFERDWAASQGMRFDGNTNNVNQRRKSMGKKPFAIAKGLLQSGYRVY